jgi:hypothetical protein
MTNTAPADAPPSTAAASLSMQWAAAELYMLDVLGVPAHLLPPELVGHPLQVLSIELRKAVARRHRLMHRVAVAGQSLTGALAVLADTVEHGAAPRRDTLAPADLGAVAELTGRIAELDRMCAELAATLASTAREYDRQHPRTT